MKFLIFLFIIAYILSGIYEVKKTIPKKKKSYNKRKTKKKNVYVIDASKEMDLIYAFLTENYKRECNYEEINEIEENDRLSMLQWIWKRYDYHISDKKLKETFSKYDFSLVREIYIIESSRVFAFYHQMEFIDNYKNSSKQPLAYISSPRLYNQGAEKQYFCRVKDILQVFSFLLQNRDEFGYTMPSFLIAPFDDFVSKCEHNYLYLWNHSEFAQYTPQELKKYCKKEKLGYPFK